MNYDLLITFLRIFSTYFKIIYEILYVTHTLFLALKVLAKCLIQGCYQEFFYGRVKKIFCLNGYSYNIF